MVSGETMLKTVYDISASTTPQSTGYALGFIIGALSEFRAYITDGNGDSLVDSANYTLSSEVQSVVATTCTFSTTYTFPEGATKLTLTREVKVEQEIDLANGEKINADTIEEGLDNNCRISLMLAEQIKRAPKMSISSEEEAPVFPDSVERAGKMLAFDENGNFAPVLTTDVEQKLAEALAAEEATLAYKQDAANSAATATTKAEEAETSRKKAQSSFLEAAICEGNAASSAEAAAASALGIAEAEGRAKTSATAAANSATEAAKQEKNAEEAATLATQKATEAETHAEFCVILKDDTATLKTQAEASALNAAQSASEAAETRAAMSTEIETAKADITTLKGEAVDAINSTRETAVAAVEQKKTDSVNEVNTTKETAKTEITAMQTKIEADIATLKKFEQITVEPDSSYSVLLLDKNNDGSKMSFDSLATWLKTHEGDQELSTIIDLIDRGEFKNVYQQGDAILSTFTDGSTVYEYPLIVVDPARDVVLADGATAAHRAIFQPMYSTPWDIQYSQYRAFLRCPTGLSAGSYKVSFAQTWSKLTTLEWYFTLTHDVPAGGRLNAFHNFADGQSDLSVRTYGNDGKLLYTDATVTSTAIDGATDLGTMAYTTRNGNLNDMQESFYGWNDYEHSAAAQFLESDKAGTGWWVAQDDWDCEPSANTARNGFLSYLDADLVKALKTVQVKTAYNNAQGHSGEFMTGYHRAFLPSLEEMYIVNQGAGEGDYLPYWKERSGLDSPASWYTARSQYSVFPVNNHTSANYIWLRSAGRGDSCRAWYVDPSGNVRYHNYCRDGGRLLPLVVL